MIEQETRPCPQGLDGATLSALRDESLPAAELRHLREHTATCESCQTRLAGFERIQRALRRQPELEPGNRIWFAVRERAMTTPKNSLEERRDGFRPGLSGRFSTAPLRGLAAAASILLVVGLLAAVLADASGNRPGSAPSQTVSRVTPNATADTTPNAPPSATTSSSEVVLGPQLNWQQRPVPPQGGNPIIDPANGDDGYICQQPTSSESSAHIYVTRDGAQTWTHAGDVPVGANPQPSNTAGKPDTLYCQLTVDASTPATAVVATIWKTMGAEPPYTFYTFFATFDFGAHWQKFLASNALVTQPTTYKGRIYALRGDDSTSSETLWASGDQMVTWQVVGSPLPNTIQAFWLNPKNGALLAQVPDSQAPGFQFYTSTDGGAHWTERQPPALGQNTEWVVQQPQAGAPWQICEGVSPLGSGPQSNSLACTADGGQTWATRSALNIQENSPKGFTFTATMAVFAISDDGAVLATVIGPDPEHVYRLPAGANTWQDLGRLPEIVPNGLNYFPAPGAGLLSYSGQPGAYTATYPGV